MIAAVQETLLLCPCCCGHQLVGDDELYDRAKHLSDHYNRYSRPHHTMTFWSTFYDVRGNVGNRPWSLELRQKSSVLKLVNAVIVGNRRWSEENADPKKKFCTCKKVLMEIIVIQRFI